MLSHISRRCRFAVNSSVACSMRLRECIRTRCGGWRRANRRAASRGICSRDCGGNPGFCSFLSVSSFNGGTSYGSTKRSLLTRKLFSFRPARKSQKPCQSAQARAGRSPKGHLRNIGYGVKHPLPPELSLAKTVADGSDKSCAARRPQLRDYRSNDLCSILRSIYVVA
jgi:hypothetical protein